MTSIRLGPVADAADWPQAVTNATVMMIVAKILGLRTKSGNPRPDLDRGVRRQFNQLWGSQRIDQSRSNHIRWVGMMEAAWRLPVRDPEALLIVYFRLKEYVGGAWDGRPRPTPTPQVVGYMLNEMRVMVDDHDIDEVMDFSMGKSSVLGDGVIRPDGSVSMHELAMINNANPIIESFHSAVGG